MNLVETILFYFSLTFLIIYVVIPLVVFAIMMDGELQKSLDEGNRLWHRAHEDRKQK